MATENILERNKHVYLHMKAKLDFNSSNLVAITRNINLIEKIGQFAWRNHPGCFFDAEIENLLLGYGQKLENYVDVERISQEIEDLFEFHKENSTLHVASEIANIGGHTRVINQIIKRSKEKNQGFILTKREVESVPVWFKEGVDVYAKTLSLISYNSPLDKAYALKIISKRFKRIILYHHPFDVVPSLAFAKASTIPVIVENHAHSWFWFGKSITDMVFSHTEFNTEFTKRYRKIDNSFYLPFTQSDNIETLLEVDEKRQARETLKIDTNKTIILTVATREKFIPNLEYNFFEIAENILQKNSDVVFIVVGLSENDVLVQSLNKSERVFIYDPTPDLKIFYLASDICLEAMPQPSLGVQLQAPIIGLSCPFPKYGKSKVFRSRMPSQSKLYSKHFGKEMTENEFYEKIQYFINNPQLCLAVAQEIRSNLIEQQYEQGLYENILKMYNEIDSLTHTTKFLEKTIFYVDQENNEIAERSELQSWSEVLDFWRSEINNNELTGIDSERFQKRKNNINKLSLKLIAIYLPQYHPIPENDEAWGTGFTEWTNVSKAKPLYPSHYQPHVPVENNYYDLRSDEIRKEQIDLAKEYGIEGFCYYYYWFNGKQVLETPITKLLKNKDLDFPFCICWANENWTKRWDGRENDIIIPQHHNFEDDYNFIHSLFPFFEDERYITINDKPVVVIYRTELFPDIKKTSEIWREEARKAGFKGVYLVRVEGFVRNINPEDIGFDAAMEFAPDFHEIGENLNENGNLHPNLDELEVYNYKTMMDNMINRESPSYKMFRSVTPNWDNTPRKGANGLIIENSSAEDYEYWLTKTINYTEKNREGEEKIVFINAWNEWGEGNHLEPDEKNGYNYLAKTKSALDQSAIKFRLLNSAEKSIQNEEYGDAKKSLDIILNNNSHDIEALIDYSIINIYKNDIQSAIYKIETVLELDPNNEIALENLQFISENGEIGEKSQINGHNNLKTEEHNKLIEAEKLIESNNYDKATKLLGELLIENPNNIDALNDLVVINILNNKHQEAINIINKVRAIDPQNEIALENLQFISENSGIEENSESNVPYFSHNGYCPCCEEEVVFMSKDSWFRDNLLCSNCHSIPRERALFVIIEKYYPNWRNLHIHESSPCSDRGVSFKLQNNAKNYEATYFYHDKPLGEFVGKYQNQNLESQTFCDESFDIVITQDVMEHIYEPKKAFSEIARTLKPGGAHIFTVPLINKHNKTEVWATKGSNGTPVFTKTPEWHGNPIDSNGSPVTMHWGFDIVDFIKDSSGLETKVEFIDNLDLGIQAEFIEVLVSKKEEIINKDRVNKYEDEIINKLFEAESLIGKSKLTEASIILEELILENENNIDALNDLSVIAILKKEYSEAELLIDRVIDIDPKNEIALENLQYISENTNINDFVTKIV
jgi:SAM-dependent methyltransferase